MKIAVTRPQKVTLYVSPDFQKLTADAKEAAEAAGTSESNAATSAADAETFKNQSESAKNAAEFAQSETESLRNEVIIKTLEALTSANNAADDADDAELQAQSTGPFTDSNGDSFDKGAKGFAADAETARDAITDKIQTTGYSEGDLLRVDATGKAVPISEVEVLKNKDAFKKSLSIFPEKPSNVFAWDNFERSESSLSTSDSGHTYVNYSGDGGSVDNELNLTTDNNIVGIAYGETRLRAKVVMPNSPANNSRRGGFCWGKDADNYVMVSRDRNFFFIDKKINGADTLVSSNVLQIANPDSLSGINYLNKNLLFDIRISQFASDLSMTIKLQGTMYSFDFEADKTDLLNGDLEIEFFGFTGLHENINIQSYIVSIN